MSLPLIYVGGPMHGQQVALDYETSSYFPEIEVNGHLQGKNLLFNAAYVRRMWYVGFGKELLAFYACRYFTAGEKHFHYDSERIMELARKVLPCT